MVTVHLIADQDRLEKLFDFTGDYPQLRFRVSHSLRQGIQDMAEEPPAVLFVQNHLSGLSGEIIVRHLIAQTEGARPLVVLFGDAGSSPSGQDPIDACLDSALPDKELTAAIIGIISEATTRTVEEETAPEPAPAEEEPDGALPELPAAPVAIGEEAPFPPSLADSPAEVTGDPPDTDMLGEPKEAVDPLTPETLFDLKLKAVLEQTPEPISVAQLDDDVREEAGAAPEPTPRVARQRNRHFDFSSYTWIAVGTIIIVAAGTIIALVSSPGSQKNVRPVTAVKQTAPIGPLPPPQKVEAPPSAPVPTQPPAPAAVPTPKPAPAPSPVPQPAAPAPAAKARGLAELPSFIPREGIDRNYAAQNPGWERYRGARTEFKVFRENTAIMAVQAIDRSGVGIPEAFLRGALSQMTGTQDFTLDGKEPQGKFLVERGKVASGSRILIYRTGPGGLIRAFVISFN